VKNIIVIYKNIAYIGFILYEVNEIRSNNPSCHKINNNRWSNVREQLSLRIWHPKIRPTIIINLETTPNIRTNFINFIDSCYYISCSYLEYFDVLEFQIVNFSGTRQRQAPQTLVFVMSLKILQLLFNIR